MNAQRIQLLKQYIEEDPNNPFNTYALAMEYYESSPEESMRLLDLLLDNHPSYLPTYFKAAHLVWEIEEWDKAERIFLNGIELAEEQKDAKALKELKAAYQNFQFERD